MATGTTSFFGAWDKKKLKLAIARARNPVAWYRWTYNIPPHAELPISIFEIELEMLAKSKEEEIKKYGAENVTFIDSELAEDEMEDELSRLMAAQGTEEEVSLEQAMMELELEDA